MALDFLSRFTAPPPPAAAVGLDFDEKSVKMVELNGAATELLSFAIKEVSPVGEPREAIAHAIREVLSKLKFHPEDIYTSVSGVGVSLRRFTVPKMPAAEMKEVIRWEARNHIPFPIETVSLGHTVLGETTEKGAAKLEVMVAAAQRDLLDHHLATLQAAGVQPAGVTVASFALWEVLKKAIQPKEGEVIAIVDIGADASSINLYKSGTLHFTREITVAGDTLTRAITGMAVSGEWQTNLTPEEAEKVKSKYGIPAEGTSEITENKLPLIQVLEVMRPVLRRLLNEILRSFDYYKEQFHEAKIDRVYLAGGSARLKGLDQFLSDGLGIKTEVINPLQNIAFDSAAVDAAALKETAPRLTAAIGLALERAQRINLSPIKKKKRAAAREPAKAAEGARLGEGLKIGPLPIIAVGILAVTLVLFLTFYYFSLNRSISRYQKELTEKQVLLTNLRTLSERRALIEKISREKTDIRRVLSRLLPLMPKDMSLVNLAYQNAARQVVIAGESPTSALIGGFLTDLEDSPYFKNVVFKEALGATVAGRPGLSFQMLFQVE